MLHYSYATLCYSRAILHYVTLCYTKLCYTELLSTPNFSTLWSTDFMQCTKLCFTALNSVHQAFHTLHSTDFTHTQFPRTHYIRTYYTTHLEEQFEVMLHYTVNYPTIQFYRRSYSPILQFHFTPNPLRGLKSLLHLEQSFGKIGITALCFTAVAMEQLLSCWEACQLSSLFWLLKIVFLLKLCTRHPLALVGDSTLVITI